MATILDEVVPGKVLSVSNSRTGDVWITDFDRGVITTLGGEIRSKGDIYVIKNVSGISPPPDPTTGGPYEGVPVYFSFPDERIDTKILPSFVVRRDEITPAMSRWQLGNYQYRLPAVGSNTVTVRNPRTNAVIASGPDETEEKSQASPFDLLYTIQIRARYRNNLKVEAMKMLQYVMRRYQPYTTVYVKDSLDELRSYTAFMESPSALDTKPDVAGREIGFNVSLRVEAELDLNDPILLKTLSSLPTVNTGTNSGIPF